MKTIDEVVREIESLQGLAEEHLDLISGCGSTASMHPGEYFFREGDPADTFFAIRSGTVALEIAAPARPPLVVETVHGGDLLGWSWLFPPYRVRYDARAVDAVHAIAFDGACLRGKCDEDHDLGFELMRRFAAIIVARLQATRARLLDVYGDPSTGG